MQQLCEADLYRWKTDKHEVEIVDMLLWIRDRYVCLSVSFPVLSIARYAYVYLVSDLYFISLAFTTKLMCTCVEVFNIDKFVNMKCTW